MLLIEIYRSLHGTFGLLKDWPQKDWPQSNNFKPHRFEVVVGAILTQNTSWQNVEKALSGLVKANLVSPQQIDECSFEGLQEAISSSGFYKRKSRYLKEVSRFILDYPTDFYTSVKRHELLAILGIGAETADCILLYACDQTHFVVDDYSLRILSRFGLLEKASSYQEVQRFFETSLPLDIELYKYFHALLVEHAKRICRSKPLCQSCVLKLKCAYALNIRI